MTCVSPGLRIVDYVRSCYTTKMAFAPDGTDVRQVRWFFTPPNTPVLGFYTRYASGNWASSKTGWTGAGEVQGARREWVDGSMPPGLATVAPWGSLEVHARGNPPGQPTIYTPTWFAYSTSVFELDRLASVIEIAGALKAAVTDLGRAPSVIVEGVGVASSVEDLGRLVSVIVEGVGLTSSVEDLGQIASVLGDGVGVAGEVLNLDQLASVISEGGSPCSNCPGGNAATYSVVLSGFTGADAVMNGTWSLAQDAFDPCTWDGSPPTDYTLFAQRVDSTHWHVGVSYLGGVRFATFDATSADCLSPVTLPVNESSMFGSPTCALSPG